jgi:outer membrane protein assembly factor BamB
VSGTGADGAVPGPGRGAEPGPELARRRLLLAGGGVLSAAGLGAVVWQASRPGTARPRAAAVREPPARRAAIWRARVPVPRPQRMAAAGGVVYVAGDDGVYWTPHARGVLQALNARDGSRRWAYTVPMGRPGTVYSDPPGMAAGPGYVVYFAANDLTCLRASDGATVWSVPSPLTTYLTAGPDAVYAVAVALYALSRRHGTRLWSFSANARTAPLLADGVLYVPGYDTYDDIGLMLAIRASDGARLWDSPGPGGRWLACDGTTVCAVSGVDPDAQPPPDAGPGATQMCTYRASDGKLLYRSAVNAGYCSQPAMTAGLAFALTAGDGHIPSRLHAVDPGTGQTAWSYPGASAAPAAARGRVYTASPAGDLIALNASDGTPVWQCPVRVTLGPVIAGHTVYVCDNTTVYAVPA